MENIEEIRHTSLKIAASERERQREGERNKEILPELNLRITASRSVSWCKSGLKP